MKNFTHELWQSAKVLTIALVLSVGVQYASAAWTGPTATPPNENTPAPINVSATSQIKSGGLWVGSLGADGGGYFGGNVGIGVVSPSQKLSVAGIVESTSGGVKFPDGTTQTTAASGGGITLSQEYSVGFSGRGSQSLNMGGGHKACFLTKIYTADGGESCDHWCQVYPDGSNWTIYAYEAWDCPGSASVQCYARCID